MPFVPAICPICNGTLIVDSSKDAAICEYCGNPYIVEKSITLHQINNNIHANSLTVVGEKEFVIHAGELVKYNGEAIDVVVPNGVIKIGEAFQNMKYLRTISVPPGVLEISPFAFQGCINLQEVYLPDSIRRLPSSAFADCKNVKIHGLSEKCEIISRYICPVCGHVFEGSIPVDYLCPLCGVPGNKFRLIT